jgi:diguanylate cyclase (GGDEF)-like protein/PAS domain S-box-containing protein
MKELHQISDRICLLIKRWLAPPVFPDNELMTRRASLLDMTLLVTIALGFIILVGNLLGGRTPLIIIEADIGIVAVGLILRYLAHNAQVRWASIVLIALGLIGTTAFCANLGTIRTPTTAFYLLIVVDAGLLFDVSGILVTTLLSSLAILGLIWAENAGWLLQPDYTVTITQWITYTALVGLAGGLTWMALRSTRQALQCADEEIKERERVEEELKASEQYARGIIDSSLDMIVTTDNERRIVEFNRAAQETFGYLQEDVLGKHIEMLYAGPPESNSIRAAMLKEGKFVGEVFNKRKNGELFTSLLSATTLRGANGEILGTVGVARDFTERKQAEEARRQAEEKYRIIFETAVEGMFQSTREGRFLTANLALAHMWGYASPHELIRSITNIAQQVYVDPTCRAKFQQLINEQGQVQGFEYEVRRTDGSTIWVSENAHSVNDDHGDFLYFESTIEDITVRKRMEEENLRRTSQLEALRQTSLELTAQLDLPSLLRAISERAVKLMHATTGSFYLYRPERDLLERIIFHGPALVNSATTRRRGEGLIGKVWETREPVVANDYGSWAGRNTGYDNAPSRAVVGIPISWRDNFLGVLTVVADHPKTFASEDIDLLKLFADQAAIAIENARLFEETKRRADQFRALHETAHDLALLQDLPTLLQTTVERAVRLLAGAAGGMYMYGATRGDLRVEVSTHPSIPIGTRLNLGEGMAGRVAQSRQPLIVNDYKTWVHRSPKYEGSPLSAVVEVPMLYSGELIGVLVVEEIGETTHQFTKEDAQMLSLFAEQAAGAVYNTRLFEQAKQRAEEFAALYETARALSTQQDLPALLQTIVERAMALLHTPSGFIYLYDATLGEMELTVSKGLEFPIGTRLKIGEGMAGQVALTQAPLIVDDYQTWEGRAPKIASAPYRAIVEVPMQVGGKLIGVLGVNEFGESTRTFTEPDARLLSLFAAQAAAAVRSAGLLAETRRYAEQLALLYEAGLSLNRVLNPVQQLPVFGEHAMKALHSDRVDFFRLDAERHELRCAFNVGYAETQTKETLSQLVFPIGAERGLVGFVAQQRKILNLGDVRADPRWMVIDPEIRSVLWVPVEHGNQLLGVLSILSTRLNAFTLEDERLLELFANEAAIAMENARLFESTERRLVQLSTLREIDRTLNSILDLTPVLETMLTSLEQIVPYDCAAILLLNGKILRAVAARGREQAALKDFALDISENVLFEQMARTLTPVVVNDLWEQANWAVVSGVEFARSWLGAPLVARGTLIGQIGLFGSIPNSFTSEHADLLLAFANQAAIAIANAKLREELSEQARRDSLTQLLNHGTFIHELQVAGKRAEERAEPRSLIMFDLDHFKDYNDTYGHVVGDEILRAAVQAIRLHVKQTDLVGRWGGEEFVVALPGTDTARAEQVAVRIRATLTKVHLTDNHARPIPAPTASQGIATYPETASTVDELIEQADRALYRAKTRGRDQIARVGDET